MVGNVVGDVSGGGSEGRRQWASEKRQERTAVLAVEAWGEAVVVAKEAAGGGGEEDGGRRLLARKGLKQQSQTCHGIILSHC